MVLRIVIAVLWFFAVGWCWNLLGLVTGLPSFPGLIAGVIVAVLVFALRRGSPARPDVASPRGTRSLDAREAIRP